MKKLTCLQILCICWLFSFLSGWGQEYDTKIGPWTPAASLTFCAQDTSHKELRLDFSSDTLKTSGDLPYDEATEIFLKYIRVGVLNKLDTLDMLKTKLKQINNIINGESKKSE